MFFYRQFGKLKSTILLKKRNELNIHIIKLLYGEIYYFLKRINRRNIQE